MGGQVADGVPMGLGRDEVDEHEMDGCVLPQERPERERPARVAIRGICGDGAAGRQRLLVRFQICA